MGTTSVYSILFDLILFSCVRNGHQRQDNYSFVFFLFFFFIFLVRTNDRTSCSTTMTTSWRHQSEPDAEMRRKLELKPTKKKNNKIFTLIIHDFSTLFFCTVQRVQLFRFDFDFPLDLHNDTDPILDEFN